MIHRLFCSPGTRSWSELHCGLRRQAVPRRSDDPQIAGPLPPQPLAGLTDAAVPHVLEHWSLHVIPFCFAHHYVTPVLLCCRYTLLFDYTITSFLWIIILMSVAGVSSETIGEHTPWL